jgi:hypothetical protein
VAYGAGILLALTGVIGVVLAVRTINMMKRQVDTFISKERARISVDIRPFNPSGANPFGILYDESPMPPAKFKISRVDLCVANSGETNAFIRYSLCKVCIKPIGWDAQKESNTSPMGLPQVMHPHTKAFRRSFQIETGHMLRSEVDSVTAQAIAEGSLGVYVIGHIEFEDVFDNRWTVKFCRKWGAWTLGGQWQDTSSWYEYPPQEAPGELPMNGELRIKKPTMLRRILRRMSKRAPHAPVIEIT